MALISTRVHAQALSEDFDDGEANGWKTENGDGEWEIPSGPDRYYTHPDTEGGTLQISTYKDAVWETNFVLRGRVKLWGTNVNNRVGLVYNYRPAEEGLPAKYYAVMMHKASSGARLLFIENTAGTPSVVLPEETYPVPLGGDPDNFYVDLTISRLGTKTTVKVSNSQGSVVHTRTQTSISGAGRVGVIDLSAKSAFDNIIVDDITPGITEEHGSGPVYQPTHFVDSNAPDDSGDGSFEDPWKYPPWMSWMPGATSGRTASPGHVIALKRGSEWRIPQTWSIMNSGTSTQPIVFTAYGSGDLPKITVLEDISTGWTVHSGHVYKRATSFTVHRLYINGVAMGEAASDTVDDTQNWVGQTHRVSGNETNIRKYWKQPPPGSGQPSYVYLYSPDGPPSSLGAIEALKDGISFAVRVFNKSHVYLDRLEVHGGTTAVVNIDVNHPNVATDVRVTNCVVRSARQKGIRVYGYTGESGGLSNGVIKWNIVDSGDGPTTKVTPDNVTYGVTGSPGPVELQPHPGDEQLPSNDGISLWNNVRNWVVAQNEVSNFWHTQIKVCINHDTYGPALNNIIEHNEAHAAEINYAHGIEINCDGNTDTQKPDRVVLLQNNIVRYNNVYNTWVNNKHEGNDTKFYGNLIVGVVGSPRDANNTTGWSGDGLVVNGYNAAVGGIIAYNTIVDAGNAALALSGQSNGAIPNGLVVVNNILSHSGNKRVSQGVTRYIAFRDQDEETSVVEVDVNLMYSPNTSQVYEYDGRGSWTTVAGMEAGESSWNDNIGANPLFTNYSAADLTLGGSSPARNAAKDITALLPETLGWNNLGCWQTP